MTQAINTEIPINDIVISKTNPRKHFDDVSIHELAESIKKVGVIQPIVVRRNGKEGKFELVCGERRLKGSKLAKKEIIPAVIRDLSDDDAFDLQITENLQRKDVHPMDEAVAFKTLHELKKHPVLEIAQRFGKSESYVAMRLKLNDLLPEAQKLFFENKMLLGHALLICRLTSADQKECIKSNTAWGTNELKTVAEMQHWISRSIVRNLSQAPWKKDDEKLLPAAGSCNKCPKRSGANTLLFPDIKEDDRCFDSACFLMKKSLYTMGVVTEALQQDPNISLLRSGYDKEPDQAIVKLAKDYKTPILKKYDGFREADKKSSKVQGIYVSGDDAGKKVYITIEKSSSSAKTSSDAGKSKAQIEIETIRERQKRAVELDRNAVFEKIQDVVDHHKNMLSLTLPQNKIEKALLWWMLVDEIGYHDNGIKKIFKKLDLDDPSDYSKAAEKLLKLTASECGYIIRKYFQEKFMDYGFDGDDTASCFLRSIAKSWGIPVEQFDAEQKKIAEDRTAKANKRIAELQEQNKKKPSKKN